LVALVYKRIPALIRYDKNNFLAQVGQYQKHTSNHADLHNNYGLGERAF